MATRRDFEGLAGSFFETTDGSPTGYVTRIMPAPKSGLRWFIPQQIVYGQYAEMGVVGRANFEDWEELFEEGEDDWWFTRKEAYGTRAVVIDMESNNIPDEAFEILSALQDTFMIDEETVSRLKDEEQEEAWEGTFRDDFGKEIEKIFDIEMEDEALDEIFEIGRERANEYWAHTSEGPWINVEKVAMALNEEDFEA
jgi:hypothetical protein